MPNMTRASNPTEAITRTGTSYQADWNRAESLGNLPSSPFRNAVSRIAIARADQRARIPSLMDPMPSGALKQLFGNTDMPPQEFAA